MWLLTAVIPHHHHNNEICIVSSHSDDACGEHDHDHGHQSHSCGDHHHHHPKKESHSHSDEEEDDECMLELIKVLPVTNHKRPIEPDLNNGDELYHYSFEAISDENCQALSPPVDSSSGTERHFSSFYDNIVRQSLGLRGPPNV